MSREQWEFDWKQDGWEFNFSPLGGGLVYLDYDAVQHQGVAVYWRAGQCPARTLGQSIPWPWPQADTLDDPAEVVAVCRLLAAKHLGGQS